MIGSRISAAILAAFVLILTLLPQAAFAQTSAAPYQSATRYDAAGRPTGTISAPVTGSSGPFLATRMTYDSAGRPILVEEGSLSTWQAETVAPSSWGAAFTLSRKVDTTFDRLDRKLTVKVTGSDGIAASMTQYSYDSLGRLECTAVRMNPTTWGSLPASACTQTGTPATCTDDTAINSAADDRITRSIYDNAGQVLKVQKAYGTCIQEDYATYTYSDNGKVTSMTDAKGFKASMTYDGFDRQTDWNFPSPTTPGTVSATDYEHYAYDVSGNRTSFRKRDGSVISYAYDNLNRVTVKTVPERSGLAATHTRDVYYSYDLRSLMTGARFDSASGEGATAQFDGFGRLSSSTLTMDGTGRTLGYQYDGDSNRTRVTHPDANYVTYSYDGLDRPSAILRSGTATVASYTYNSLGQRTGFNGGVSTGYGYDAVGRLTTLTNNLTASTYNNQWTFAFNPAGQIVSNARSNDTFAWTGNYNVSRDYQTNGLNQYTTAGSAAFCYDANGNLTADGSSVYLYDIENRLVEKRAQGTGNTNCTALSYAGALQAGLRYDPMGRLYEVTGSSGTTRMLYDGDALTAEYDVSGNLLRRYIHGADLKADDPIAWYEGGTFASTSERIMRPDRHGSIVLVTDSTGANVLAVNRYDEFGIPQSTNSGRFQYTGQAWLTELGMYYYKARIYSPTLGRFLQTDPIGYKDQVNLYAYVGGDPVDAVDPSGARTTFIGGFNDENSEIVKSYAEAFAKANPKEVVNYFPYYEWKSAASVIGAPLRKGERNIVVGHSFGGSNALAAVTRSNQHVNLLITIDPVGLPPQISTSTGSFKPANLDYWMNVVATPSKSNASDFVAFLGGGKMPASGADEQTSVDANHEDFARMMNQSGAENKAKDTKSGDYSIDGTQITGTRSCGSKLKDTGC